MQNLNEAMQYVFFNTRCQRLDRSTFIALIYGGAVTEYERKNKLKPKDHRCNPPLHGPSIKNFILMYSYPIENRFCRQRIQTDKTLLFNQKKCFGVKERGCSCVFQVLLRSQKKVGLLGSQTNLEGGGVKGERRQQELERGKKAPRVSAFVVGYLPMKG